MRNEHLSLNKIIDLDKWSKLQDSLSQVTKAAIILVDYKGNPVTHHSGCQEFCKKVRTDETLLKYCKKCDARGGLEGVLNNKPYIYLCHFNIVDIAIPITIEGKYLGALMAGQIKLKDDHPLEKVVHIQKQKGYGFLESHKEAYDSLPIMTYESVEAIGNLLENLLKYIIDEALEKHLLADLYGKSSGEVFKDQPLDLIHKAKKDLSNAIIHAHVSDPSQNQEERLKVSGLLKPAIDYIYDHKSEQVSAQKASELCHLSVSYFSRLFVKETGQKYSLFMPQLKVQWAKKCLEETEMSITEISDGLGYQEPGYFIKVFKKYEGVTPLIYRKYYKL